MKNKFSLVASIFQIIIGLVAIVMFFTMGISEQEIMTKWIVTLFLAVAFILLGIVGVLDYMSDKKQNK